MVKITTHVLDTARGCPAAGVPVQIWKITEDDKELLAEKVTNADGRTDSPLLEGQAFVAAEYEIVFFLAAYFARVVAGHSPPFLRIVPVRVFCDPREGNYHIPLLCSPWSYTTYRGS